MKPYEETSDSFDDEELLADLGSLGLAFKESKKDLETSKSIKKHNSSQKRQGKRRPPSTKPIDLDALLGGNDNMIPNLDPIVTTTKSSTNNTPISQMSSPISQAEARVSSYLSMKLKTVLNEVSVYIDNSLRETDNTCDIVDTFITDFRQSIREMIDFRYEELISIPTANSLIEPFAPHFHEVFKEIESFINKRPFNGCNKLRSLRGLIATWPSILRSTYNASTNELIQEVAERNITLSQHPIVNLELKSRLSKCKLQMFDLKCQEEIQNKDSAYLQKQIDQIEESRRKFFQNKDTLDTINEQDINSILRKQIARLQNVLDRSGPNSVHTSGVHNVDGIIEEIQSMRSVKFNIIDQLQVNTRDFRNSSLTIIPAPQLPFSYLPLPQENYNIPTIITEPSAPVQPLQMEEEVDGPDMETTIFIEKIRRRMARIQKKAARDAESADEFLEKMKRKDRNREKKR